MYPRPTLVQPGNDYILTVTFEDGVRAELDFNHMVNQAGILGELKYPDQFRRVKIDPEAETLVWPNCTDICPDVLYHLATGASLPGHLHNPPARLIRREQAEAVAGL